MSCTSVGASAFGEILDESTSIAFPCLFVLLLVLVRLLCLASVLVVLLAISHYLNIKLCLQLIQTYIWFFCARLDLTLCHVWCVRL